MDEFIRKYYGNHIVYAAIFGSHVYGTATKDSDTDIYVVLNKELEKDYEIICYNDHNIDITLTTLTNFLKDIENNDVKAIEVIFVPEKFVLIGNQKQYQELFKADGAKLRKTFGSVCRKAWNRGVKKLTIETDKKEHTIGKKSLFHAIRLFACAIEIKETGKLTFGNIQESIDFYNEILYQDPFLMKQEYIDLYKRYDKEFKRVVN